MWALDLGLRGEEGAFAKPIWPVPRGDSGAPEGQILAREDVERERSWPAAGQAG